MQAVAGITFANANGGTTVMEARGKERDVAVQYEAPEFLACSDLDLSGSIVQQIKRPDLPGIEAQSRCCA